MRNPEVEKTQFTTLLGVFALIMMAIFAAEVTVMQLFGELFADLNLFQRALLDATALVLIIALPLWFFIFSPVYRDRMKEGPGATSVAVSLYAKVLIGLYLVQLAVMMALPNLMIYLPAVHEDLIDGGLTVLLSAPFFWWLIYRLEINCRLEPLADFLTAPITLYVLLLFMVFLADLLQEILIPRIELPLSDEQYRLFDGLVTVLLIAPLLFMLVLRPLMHWARSEKARTNAIYDQVVDAIVRIDHEGTIESFNLAAQNFFGFRAAEMIGKSASLLLDPGQIDLAAALFDLGEDSEGKTLKFNELTASLRDGERLTLDVSISKVKLDGPDEFLLLLHDISERKAAEDALLATDAIFREIFDQTEDSIIFIDPVSRAILDVNATTESLYGFSKRELQLQGVAVLCDKEGFRRFADLITRIIADGSGSIENLINYKKGDSEIVVSVRGKMMTLQGAQVIFCTVRDISERMRLEREAREIQAKLIHANKMTSLGLLVSGVAHEINNPNNFVLSNAQLLSRIWKDAQIVLTEYYREHGDFVIGGMNFSELENYTPEILNGVTDGSRRINAIVTNLKRFVRQDPAEMATNVDINEVVTSAISLLHYELIKHTDDFQISLGDDLPSVKGSSQQLGQVVINLLMNACQALPDKSRGVWLVTDYEPHRQMVRISVRDQGTGLPEELKDKILEPFFTTKLETGGTGLGLSISQTIVKDHGGQIEFFSQPGSGTTFTVNLPVSSSV